MVWAKLDDEILDNEKVTRAGVLGFALHVAAITWCCRKLTDGFVPYSRVRLLLDMSDLDQEYLAASSAPSGTHRGFLDAVCNVGSVQADLLADKLTSIGLWVEDKDRGGYWIHDFLDYNPSRQEAESLRETRSAAGKKGASGRWADGKSDGKSHGKRLAKLCPDPDPDPDPEPREILPPLASLAPPSGGSADDTGPITQVKRRGAARGTRLPSDWLPSAETQAWAREHGIPDPFAGVAEFLDFWAGVPGARGVKLDWDATYRNRLRQTLAGPVGRPSGTQRVGYGHVQSAENRAWKLPEGMS